MNKIKQRIEEIDAELAEISRWYDRHKKQVHLYTREWNVRVRREHRLHYNRNQLNMRALP